MKSKRVNHGLSKTPLYAVWVNMKRRCKNPNRKDYKYYGGRGIKVCKKWDESFLSFKEDMETTYKSGLELDRIDTNGDYTPDNCRWATRRQQVSSRRPTGSLFDTKYITKDGITKTVSEWAEEVGIRSKALSDRMNKLGWCVEKSISGVKRGKTKILFDGKIISIKQVFEKTYDYLNNSRDEGIAPQQYLANILPFVTVLFSWGGVISEIKSDIKYKPKRKLPKLKTDFEKELLKRGISYDN